ncbi:hypothetical protein CEXT_591 [Caerostris extrusa]|uniref:Secreted protein n=1 Tax=Caerostris extrusa TaxID=172846 RepID=A0AAV4RUT9_CAEEX|nr:hypothetical protein CEXT_591 [Caerostris extrusa]
MSNISSVVISHCFLLLLHGNNVFQQITSSPCSARMYHKINALICRTFLQSSSPTASYCVFMGILHGNNIFPTASSNNILALLCQNVPSNKCFLICRTFLQSSSPTASCCFFTGITSSNK